MNDQPIWYDGLLYVFNMGRTRFALIWIRRYQLRIHSVTSMLLCGGSVSREAG